jgi:hypothetical protein
MVTLHIGGKFARRFSCVEGGVVSASAEGCANRLLHFFSMLTSPGPADVAKLQMEPAWEETTLGFTQHIGGRDARRLFSRECGHMRYFSIKPSPRVDKSLHVYHKLTSPGPVRYLC